MEVGEWNLIGPLLEAGGTIFITVLVLYERPVIHMTRECLFTARSNHSSRNIKVFVTALTLYFSYLITVGSC